MTKSKTNKTGYQVVLKFYLSHHTRDIVLMNSLIQFLNCGKLTIIGGSSDVNGRAVNFVVWKIENIINKIIPF